MKNEEKRTSIPSNEERIADAYSYMRSLEWWIGHDAQFHEATGHMDVDIMEGLHTMAFCAARLLRKLLPLEALEKLEKEHFEQVEGLDKNRVGDEIFPEKSIGEFDWSNAGMSVDELLAGDQEPGVIVPDPDENNDDEDGEDDEDEEYKDDDLDDDGEDNEDDEEDEDDDDDERDDEDKEYEDE